MMQWNEHGEWVDVPDQPAPPQGIQQLVPSATEQPAPQPPAQVNAQPSGEMYWNEQGEWVAAPQQTQAQAAPNLAQVPAAAAYTLSDTLSDAEIAQIYADAKGDPAAVNKALAARLPTTPPSGFGDDYRMYDPMTEAEKVRRGIEQRYHTKSNFMSRDDFLKKYGTTFVADDKGGNAASEVAGQNVAEYYDKYLAPGAKGDKSTQRGGGSDIEFGEFYSMPDWSGGKYTDAHPYFDSWDNVRPHPESQKGNGWDEAWKQVRPFAAMVAMAYGASALAGAAGAGAGAGTAATAGGTGIGGAAGIGSGTALGGGAATAAAGGSGILSTIAAIPTTIASSLGIDVVASPVIAKMVGTGVLQTVSGLAQGQNLTDAATGGLKAGLTAGALSTLTSSATQAIKDSGILEGTGISARDAANTAIAALTGNKAGVISGVVGMGIDGVSKLTGAADALPDFLTKSNVSGVINIGTGLKNGNITQVLNGANSLVDSSDLNVAAKAAQMVSAAASGNWNSIVAAAGNLDKALGGKGAPTAAPKASEAYGVPASFLDRMPSQEAYELLSVSPETLARKRDEEAATMREWNELGEWSEIPKVQPEPVELPAATDTPTTTLAPVTVTGRHEPEVVFDPVTVTGGREVALEPVTVTGKRGEPEVEAPVVERVVTPPVEIPVGTTTPTPTPKKVVTPTPKVVPPTVEVPETKKTTPPATQTAALPASFGGGPNLANVHYYGKKFDSQNMTKTKKGKLIDDPYHALSVTQAGKEFEREANETVADDDVETDNDTGLAIGPLGIPSVDSLLDLFGVA